MRKTVRALTFVLAMSTYAYGGEMGNGIAPPPQPQTQTISEPAPSVIKTTSADGDMDTGVEVTVTKAVLNLIQNLITLF